MEYIQKFNRSLLKATPKVRDMNGGAFRQVQVDFSFSHDGKKHYLKLVVEKSHDSMKIFGYEKDSVELWEYTSASMCCGYKVDIPEGMVDISNLKKMATQTDEEAREVYNSYREAVRDFEENFLGV